MNIHECCRRGKKRNSPGTILFFFSCALQKLCTIYSQHVFVGLWGQESPVLFPCCCAFCSPCLRSLFHFFVSILLRHFHVVTHVSAMFISFFGKICMCNHLTHNVFVKQRKSGRSCKCLKRCFILKHVSILVQKTMKGQTRGACFSPKPRVHTYYGTQVELKCVCDCCSNCSPTCCVSMPVLYSSDLQLFTLQICLTTRSLGLLPYLLNILYVLGLYSLDSAMGRTLVSTQFRNQNGCLVPKNSARLV